MSAVCAFALLLGVIGQCGSALIDKQGEGLLGLQVRKGTREPKGELIGIYNRMATVEQIEADVRDALGVA